MLTWLGLTHGQPCKPIPGGTSAQAGDEHSTPLQPFCQCPALCCLLHPNWNVHRQKTVIGLSQIIGTTAVASPVLCRRPQILILLPLLLKLTFNIRWGAGDSPAHVNEDPDRRDSLTANRQISSWCIFGHVLLQICHFVAVSPPSQINIAPRRKLRKTVYFQPCKRCRFTSGFLSLHWQRLRLCFQGLFLMHFCVFPLMGQKINCINKKIMCSVSQFCYTEVTTPV